MGMFHCMKFETAGKLSKKKSSVYAIENYPNREENGKIIKETSSWLHKAL